MTTPENPSAFPHQHRASESKIVEQYSDYGLSMRDYFAAAALTGMLGNTHAWFGSMAEDLAKDSYNIADAMLAARGNHVPR